MLWEMLTEASKTLHIPDKRSRQGRDSSRTGASRSDLMIRKAGMSITKNEPCTINPYTARCLFSYHSIVNIVSYFSASGVAAASDSVLSAVSSSAFAESPSVSGVSVTSVCSSAAGVSVASSRCRICCRCLSYIRVRCRS